MPFFLTIVLHQGNREIMIHSPHQTNYFGYQFKEDKWMGCVMHTGETKGASTIFIGKQEEMKPL